LLVIAVFFYKDNLLNIFSEIAQHDQIIINLNDLNQIFAIIFSTIGLIGSIISIIAYYEDKRTDKKEGPSEVARRKSIINSIRNIMIKNILDGSLRDIDPIELDLWECGEKINPINDLPFPLPTPSTRQLRSSSKILEIFDELWGSFLVLGDPGSGKTTLLLQLTKGLLDRAESDEHNPIPAVFHLSLWADYKQPLSDWMIDELDKGYGLSQNLAKKWVKEDLILPLLDGLDEVAPENRETCIEEINKFKENHRMIPIVVCSRSKEYDVLKTRLKLSSAICVKLLSRAKIGDHLKSIGTSMDGVQVALKDDETLWELLKTPLMLNIVVQAFKGKSAEFVLGTGKLEERRTQIFDAYKDAMFHRFGRREAKSYTAQQTENWLSYLAKSMKQRNQTIFYLEKLQPDWIPSIRQRKIVTVGAGLISGLILGILAWIVDWKLFGQFVGQIFGLIVALLAIYIFTSEGPEIELLEKLKIPSSSAVLVNYLYLIKILNKYDKC
jgi:GTPase SAR1 family protein